MKKNIANERGFILVTAMVVLLLLMLIGIGGMRTSSIEVLIAGNDKFHKEAFYSADSGAYLTPILLTLTRDTAADPLPAQLGPQITLWGIDGTSLSDGTRFYNETMGFVEDVAPLDPDFQVRMGLMPVDVDIDHTGSHQQVGGGAEFGMGAAGVGAGSAAGVWIGYTLTATGQAPKSSVSIVSANYRYVPGTAGGLK
ncbi:MAG: PilX N-terminal domain-containing pilus assembly protein [Desulfobulbia bacterium]